MNEGRSLGVELAEVVPAESGVGHSFVVVVVDVLVADDSRELGLLQIAASQQSDLLQLLHAGQQLGRAVDQVGVGPQRLYHRPLQVGLLPLLLQQVLQAAAVAAVGQVGPVPELTRVRGDGVVPGAPGDAGGGDWIVSLLRSLSCLWQESVVGTGFS
jgi:hypothetical protein